MSKSPSPANNPDPADPPRERDAAGASPQSDSDYQFPHSGRRAAGHGGGSLDASEDEADYAVEPGAEFSGGGQGHAPQASQDREAKEELEGRTGPYVRSGQPAQEASDRKPSSTGANEPGEDPSSDDPDSGPPRTGGPSRPA